MNFESIVFMVEDADSPQEAQKSVEDWIKDWVEDTKRKIEAKNTAPPFESKPTFMQQQVANHKK